MSNIKKLEIRIFKENEKYFTQIDNDKIEEFELPYPYFGNYQKAKEIDEKQLPFFGNLIFENIFCTDERLSYFENILNSLRDDTLVISIISNNSSVLEIPFEILTFNENILLKNPNIHLIRRVNEEVKSFENSKSIFNILFIISLPLKIYDESPIDPLKEFSKIYEGISEFREFVNIDILENASEKAIKEALKKKEYDIIHFAGHGVENGLVIESNEDFNEDRILKDKEIKEVFEGIKAKAIILDACFTSATSKKKKQNEYYGSSVSSQFENIPIVLANQSFIGDDFATFEMENIYREIFKLKPFEILKSVRRLNHNDWWKPTLYFEGNLNEKLFELKDSLKDKRVIKTLNRFNRYDIYIYRYRPVREVLEALRQNRIVLFHGIGGSGKSHLADYIIEMLKGEFNYIIAVDMSRYKSVKEIKSYIGDFIFKEEMFLIIDNLETLLDRDGVVIDNEVEEFLREIVSEKFGGKVLFTSRIIPSFKDRSKIVDAIVEIEPYSEAEFHNLYFAYQEAKNSEICKYLKANFEKFKEYDFYPLLISKAIQNRVENIDNFIFQDEEIREILEYYLNYFKESNSLLKIAILKYPISKEFFEVLVREDKKLKEINKIVKLASFKDETYKLYEVLKRFVVGNDSNLKLHKIEKSIFKLLKRDDIHENPNLNDYGNDEYFDLLNKVNIYKKFEYYTRSIGVCYDTLGSILYNFDKFKDAEKYYKKAKKFKEKILGFDNSSIATTYNNLGLFYMEMEDLKKAKKFYFKAYDIEKKDVLKSLDFGIICDNIGLIFAKEGNFSKAENFMLKSLKVFEKIVDNDLSLTHLNQNYINLATIYSDIGDYKKAKKYFKKSLKLIKKDEIDISNKIIFYVELASYFIKHSLFHKAKKYLFKALNINKKENMNSISYRVTIWSELAGLNMSIGEISEAEKYYMKIINYYKSFGNDSIHLAKIYNDISILYMNEENFKKGLDYSIKSIKIYKKKLGETHIDTATTYSNLAEFAMISKDYIGAKKYLLKSLKIKNIFLPKNNIGMLHLYSSLGEVYQNTKELKKSKKYYQKALNISKENYGENLDTSIVYNNMASLYEEIGEFKKAEKCYFKSLKIKEIITENPLDTSINYNNLAFLYEKQNLNDKAKHYYFKSYKNLENEFEFFLDYIKFYIDYIDMNYKINEFNLNDEIKSDINILLKKIIHLENIVNDEEIIKDIIFILREYFEYIYEICINNDKYKSFIEMIDNLKVEEKL